MNSRERFLATFLFQKVDRPALDYFGEPDVNKVLLKHFTAKDMDAVLDELEIDFRRIEPGYTGPELPRFPDGREQDIWGVVRRPVRNPSGTYMEPIGLPWANFRSLQEVEAYPWPKVEWYDFARFPEWCGKYKERGIIFGRPGLMDLINGVSFGRGMEQVLLDIATQDEIGLALFRKRFEFMFAYAQRGLEAAGGNIDVLFIGEDLGTQQGLTISPAAWDKIFRPYLQRMVDLGHQFGAKVMMHSCGSVAELIPRFIQLGLDALQAVQPMAAGMAPAELAGRFGGKIVFNGTMDIQGTLPYGTPEDVRKEVQYRKALFRDQGGFILAPCHNLQSDTPIANILAMYEEGRICPEGACL